MESQYVVVEAAALNALLNFIAQAHLPMGRDQLVKNVLESVRPTAPQKEQETHES